jgi:hypothetical protein
MYWASGTGHERELHADETTDEMGWIPWNGTGRPPTTRPYIPPAIDAGS